MTNGLYQKGGKKRTNGLQEIILSKETLALAFAYASLLSSQRVDKRVKAYGVKFEETDCHRKPQT